MPDFEALFADALGRRPDDTEAIAVGVSGGPDSVALLLLAAAAFPRRVVAITVDHGLRAASAAEASGVAAQCARHAILHTTLVWADGKAGAGVPAAARAARYALMADWCAANGVALLLTAHHADDQAETLLMRLARGSGVGGLSGIRARWVLRPGVTLLRPLLAVRRAALAAIAAESGWPIVDDPTNHDPHYARTQARRLLAGTPWLDAGLMAASAAHLAEAEAALEWAADRAWAGGAVVAAGEVRLDVAGLPDEIVRRLVRRAIAALAPGADPRGPDAVRLAARLAAGGTGTLAGVRASGGATWQFRPAKPIRGGRRK
jgi:tRNA(Ile)-lysidine synthase